MVYVQLSGFECQYKVSVCIEYFGLPLRTICVPAVRLPTVGRRAFSDAGTRVWNALPVDVTSAPSLFTFLKRLKLHLFSVSNPGLVHYINFLSLRGPCGSFLLLRPP